MSAFLKQINRNPFGDKLRETRLNRGLTLRKASRDLDVSVKYLEALENYDLSLIPRDLANPLIDSYANYLGLKYKELSELRQDTESFKKVINLKKQSLFSAYDMLAKSFLWLLLSFFLLFLIYKVAVIFIPPPLTIEKPRDGLITYQRELTIVGSTVPEAEVFINNKAVLVDQKGQFSTSFDLQKGLNLIKITSKKRYSRMQEVTIRALFNE
jgi:cytoskeletal protein RodZ